MLLTEGAWKVGFPKIEKPSRSSPEIASRRRQHCREEKQEGESYEVCEPFSPSSLPEITAEWERLSDRWLPIGLQEHLLGAGPFSSGSYGGCIFVNGTISSDIKKVNLGLCWTRIGPSHVTKPDPQNIDLCEPFSPPFPSHGGQSWVGKMIHDKSTKTHFSRSHFLVLLEGPPFSVGKKLRLQIQSGASLCQARLSQCLLNQP